METGLILTKRQQIWHSVSLNIVSILEALLETSFGSTLKNGRKFKGTVEEKMCMGHHLLLYEVKFHGLFFALP